MNWKYGEFYLDKINSETDPKKLVEEHQTALDKEITESIKNTEKDEYGLYTDKEFDDSKFWRYAYKQGNYSTKILIPGRRCKNEKTKILLKLCIVQNSTISSRCSPKSTTSRQWTHSCTSWFVALYQHSLF